MVKNHIKRLTIPNTWKGIAKKQNKYIVKPSPGPHARELSMPLSILLKQLGVAKTTKECKYILHNTQVLVDGRRIKDVKFPVGFLDVLTLEETKQSYRMLLDKKGKLELSAITQNTDKKMCRVRGKRVIAKSKLQLNLSDGRNMMTDKAEYKVGDSLVIEVPSQKIAKHVSLAPGAQIILTGGKHRGDTGEVVKVEENSLFYKNKEEKEIKTLRSYAYVVDKSLL